MTRCSRRAFVGALGTAGVAGCLGGETRSDGAESGAPYGGDDWPEMPLRDARNGELFRIADYDDRYVLLDTFAMWCPVCADQQAEFERLRGQLPDEVAPVSLNTDPHEDADGVREYAQRNEFDWPFAVAPAALTQTLVDRFGRHVTVPSRTPVILVCPDGGDRFLDSPAYNPLSADQLRDEIRRGC